MILFIAGILIGCVIGAIVAPHFLEALDLSGIEADDFGPPSP
jgi:hypothetical protein